MFEPFLPFFCRYHSRKLDIILCACVYVILLSLNRNQLELVYYRCKELINRNFSIQYSQDWSKFEMFWGYKNACILFILAEYSYCGNLFFKVIVDLSAGEGLLKHPQELNPYSSHFTEA